MPKKKKNENFQGVKIIQVGFRDGNKKDRYK